MQAPSLSMGEGWDEGDTLILNNHLVRVADLETGEVWILEIRGL